MLDVKIKGMAELGKLLDELPAKIERNIVRSGLRAGAKVLQAEAKRQVPVRTGKLRDSIRVSVRLVQGKPTATIRAGGKRAPHAHFVEFGTGAHHIATKDAESLAFGGQLREGVDHPGAAMQPFMRPALDGAAQAAVMAFAQQIKKRLTKQGLDTADIELAADEADAADTEG